jgi:hypothetical protein
MKKLVNERTLYRVDGGEWRDCSPWNRIRYREENDCEEWTSRKLNFDEMWMLVEEGFVINAETGYTFFQKKRKLDLPSDCVEVTKYTYTEKENKTFEVKMQYLPYSSTLKTLAGLLPAEDFIQYLKDRGINICPMMN